MSDICLNCLTLGDNKWRLVAVDIARTANASQLKDAIEDRKKHEIGANQLNLWKVSVLP